MGKGSVGDIGVEIRTNLTEQLSGHVVHGLLPQNNVVVFAHLGGLYRLGLGHSRMPLRFKYVEVSQIRNSANLLAKL